MADTILSRGEPRNQREEHRWPRNRNPARHRRPERWVPHKKPL